VLPSKMRYLRLNLSNTSYMIGNTETAIDSFLRTGDKKELLQAKAWARQAMLQTIEDSDYLGHAINEELPEGDTNE
jgi:hypothetical protein